MNRLQRVLVRIGLVIIAGWAMFLVPYRPWMETQWTTPQPRSNFLIYFGDGTVKLDTGKAFLELSVLVSLTVGGVLAFGTWREKADL